MTRTVIPMIDVLLVGTMVMAGAFIIWDILTAPESESTEEIPRDVEDD